MKLFVGDIVKLSGKTRHGKNRIRENGELWSVMTVDGQDSSVLTTKVCVRPLDLDRRENWRWVDIPDDSDMEISLHRRGEIGTNLEEPEHVVEERKVEEAIERMSDQAQMDMFNDETMNWSGLR
jgi:hypothetical protein